MSASNPSGGTPQAAVAAVPVSEAPPVNLLALRTLRMVWSLLAWAVLGGAAAAVIAGTLLLILGEDVSGEQIAIGVLWMKLAVIVALYWATGLRAMGHAGVALKLRHVSGKEASDLRAGAKDRFSRGAGLLGDLSLAACFEFFIVFFVLLAWVIFAFHAAALVLMILCVPVAAAHGVLASVVQDRLGARVERA